MKTFWKTILALMLVLPLGGYVVGSLMSSGAVEPERRNPIVIPGDAPTSTPSPTSPGGGRPTSSGTASADPSNEGPSDDATVVTPRPEERGDDGDDSSGPGSGDDRDDDRDDDSGHDDGDDDGDGGERDDD